MAADPSPVVAGRAATVLRRLELDVTQRLDGLLHGDYRGLVPGHGSEPGETRPYAFGDDIRRIDWNVSARSIDTHVRETIADRELETWIVLDRSASLDFGTAERTKSELAANVVGAIGLLTARTGNRLGAVVLDPSGVRTIPAKSGRAHLLTIVAEALEPLPPASSAETLGSAVGRLVVPPRRRGLAVIVSDFLGADDWVGPLRSLATRHDVVAAEIVDPRELELPSVGLLRVVDTETGAVREVPTNRRTRARYAAAARDQRERIAAEFRRIGVGHLQLRTDHDWVADVAAFVRLRRRLQGKR